MHSNKAFISLLSVVTLFAAILFLLPQTNASANARHRQNVHIGRRYKHSKLSAANAAAKHFIAIRESGGSYSASNGTCYGKYQLSIASYHGNYSAHNQELTADHYANSRYGSWLGAKSFWLSHGWY
ncbi:MULTISPECIES: aggregation-promoting factor C-terminal-like domain-containing protein [Apilactobacillus]|uniref:Aggregation promoting factor surface protein n=2 Tax=Apilactobacillus TaxID=2767877 RepID=A0A9Q8MUB8_9LACO|nr:MULTISPECIES: aggregation promoting factor surface protein [Apilactobacillus]TPR14800.1 aggregation promoting factor surface protein [Apilactobacillus timberlakei]TPR15767.1 aggregation promoting factor surface protein [Apilactobacillus timberlakei]TPR16128.1 aggregation promoting factor surface protein [Apilactobacillus timberlakei]TPR18180.1 aggregation promoting factor surface protein [Apilactobacillus timberlakei]TPR18875.1 aggregation promoting factor surface protein [Apilactobacillus 